MEPRVKPLRLKVSAYPGLFAGVAGVSVAAILIRLADSPSLTVASYRMGIAAIVVAVVALLVHPNQFRLIRMNHLPWLLAGGGVLAVHFWAFITSLERTSVANSVFLVTTAPVVVAAGSHWGLRDRLSLMTTVAVVISVAGGLVLALGDRGQDQAHLTGDLLAVLGAIAAAGYYLVGRKVRASLPLAPYVVVVYATAAVLLVSGALAAGSPFTGLSAEAYFWMAMVAVISQVIGHTMLNWALGYLTATTVSLSVRAEPVIATLLAIPILSETPPWTTGAGALLILLGVYLAVRADPSRQGRCGANEGMSGDA